MKKYFLKIFIISLIISIVIAPLRSGYISIGAITGFKLSSIVGAIIYSAFTYYFLKKATGKLSSAWILAGIISGMLFLVLPIHIMDFKGTLASSLESAIYIFAVFCAYLFFKSNLYVKVFISIAGIIFCTFLSTKGYDMWMHKLNFGAYISEIEQTTIPNFQFVDEKGKVFSLNNFSGKYVMIDFWFSGCGICSRKFPQIQSLYDKYKGKQCIAIVSINARLKGESDAIAFETIREEGYSFPVYRLDMGDPVLIELGVKVYPTVLIFDPESRLVFRGNIENAGSFLDKIIK